MRSQTKRRNSEPKIMTLKDWKRLISKSKDAHGKIRWSFFRGLAAAFGRASKFGTLSDLMDLYRLTGRNPLVGPLIEKGMVDVVRIQPVPKDEPILCFTGRAEKVRFVGEIVNQELVMQKPGFVVWKGTPASKKIASQIKSDAFEIPIKLLQHTPFPFRTDVSPLKEALPALRALEVVSYAAGGDRRVPNEKIWEDKIFKDCVNDLSKKNALPSPTKLEENYDLGGEVDAPVRNNIIRIMLRVIPRAIEHIVLKNAR